MTLIYNATFDKNTRKLAFEDKAGNEIYSCTVPERTPMVDDITKPLTFRATQDGSTVKLVKTGSPSGAFQTSRDGGNTWSDYTIGASVTLNTGDEVSFRAKENRSSGQDSDKYFYFEMTGKIEAWHNAMSMYRTNDFATYESVVGFAFFRLFKGCTSLTKAPVLPATKLASFCYNGIFSGCESLTKSPVLPATKLASYCYGGMFFDCRSLNEVRCYMPSSYSSSQISNYTTNWLSGVASTGTFYTNADANWTSGASGIPTGWNRVPAVDDPNKPLMLRAIEDNSSVALEKVGTLSNTYQTSTDGTNWTDYTLGTQISLNKGESVYFRCSAHPTTQEYLNYVRFVMTGKIEAWHNAYSMISSDFSSAEGEVGDYGMTGLFEKCSSLTKAPLLLNALSPNCYSDTFWKCSSLTQAPALPATILAYRCYRNMFSGCESLTQAPALPSTTLTEYCYAWMFSGCQSLKEVRISATTTATDALTNWLENVSATGDFYCDPNATIFPTDSASGIPANWNRHALADYPVTP